MTEFTGDMANGPVDINFLIQSFVKFFSEYNFNLIELFLILSLFAINIKSKNYFFMIFFIFVINTFVMNFRYLPTYHLYYIFIYLIFFSILLKMFKFNLSLKIVNFTVIIFLLIVLIFFLSKIIIIILEKYFPEMLVLSIFVKNYSMALNQILTKILSISNIITKNLTIGF